MANVGDLCERARKRIQKEHEKFVKDSDQYKVRIQSEKRWLVDIDGPVDSPFQGEKFTLDITFTNDYPIESPIVKFQAPGPDHPHIYSNGHICLNILYDEWSPALTTNSIVLSLVSMLSSCPMKERPEDDIRYTRSHGPDTNPKHTRFIYDDDTV